MFFTRSAVLLSTLVAPARAVDLDNLDTQTLLALTRDGPLVVTNMQGDRLQQATAILYVNADPSRVWSVMSDFANYPGWMPQVETATVQDASPDAPVVAYRLSFDFFLSFKVSYTLAYTKEGPYRMSFRQTTGDFAANQGWWEARPCGSGSLFAYAATVDYRSMKLLRPILQRQPSIDVGLGTSTVAVIAEAVKRKVGG